MNFNKTAKQLQALFEETNKAVKGNWIAPETDEIVKILRDAQLDAFRCRKCGAALGWCEPDVCDKCQKAAQSKPESWQEIARECAIVIVNTTAAKTEELGDIQRLVNSCIERSHAAQPRICDQCSRKLEDGALYEDHAAQSQRSKASPRDEQTHEIDEQEHCERCGEDWPTLGSKCITPLGERSEQDDPEGFIPAWHLGDSDEAAQHRAAQSSDQPSGSGRTTDDKQEEWTVDKHNKQLIAPSGKRFSVGFAAMDGDRLAQIINAELAAERLRSEQAESDFKSLAKTELTLRLSVDLSALREHDEKLTAEVRKPLVDALERIRKELYEQPMPRSWIAEQCDDALAKAKP